MLYSTIFSNDLPRYDVATKIGATANDFLSILKRGNTLHVLIGVQKLATMFPEFFQVNHSSQWDVTLKRFSTQYRWKLYRWKSFSVTLLFHGFLSQHRIVANRRRRSFSVTIAFILWIHRRILQWETTLLDLGLFVDIALCFKTTRCLLFYWKLRVFSYVLVWTIFCNNFLLRYDDACHIDQLSPARRCRWVKLRPTHSMSHCTIFLRLSEYLNIILTFPPVLSQKKKNLARP